MFIFLNYLYSLLLPALVDKAGYTLHNSHVFLYFYFYVFAYNKTSYLQLQMIPVDQVVHLHFADPSQVQSNLPAACSPSNSNRVSTLSWRKGSSCFMLRMMELLVPPVNSTCTCLAPTTCLPRAWPALHSGDQLDWLHKVLCMMSAPWRSSGVTLYLQTRNSLSEGGITLSQSFQKHPEYGTLFSFSHDKKTGKWKWRMERPWHLGEL